jgi:hypothetical protein
VNYPHSALSRTLPGLVPDSPKGGDRLPWIKVVLEPGGPEVDLFQHLDDLHHHLLLVDQDPVPEWVTALPATVRVQPIATQHGNSRRLAAAGISAPAFYLVRSDGYIGVCGGGLHEAHAEIERYLALTGQVR